ncbi:MAG: hypothetical protein FJY21_09870, partial [Bacteroidetes bacterium]|nr:hypothetical protein [Bacteroidota bacterium]
ESLTEFNTVDEITQDVIKETIVERQELPNVSQEPPKEEVKPVKKIDFEITNPEDLDIDDKGQFGLF